MGSTFVPLKTSFATPHEVAAESPYSQAWLPMYLSTTPCDDFHSHRKPETCCSLNWVRSHANYTRFLRGILYDPFNLASRRLPSPFFLMGIFSVQPLHRHFTVWSPSCDTGVEPGNVRLGSKIPGDHCAPSFHERHHEYLSSLDTGLDLTMAAWQTTAQQSDLAHRLLLSIKFCWQTNTTHLWRCCLWLFWSHGGRGE